MKKYLIFGAIISVFLMHPVWALTSFDVAKLVASDGNNKDHLGAHVAIDSDTVVISASGDDDKGSDSGSVYIFTRSEGIWTEQAKLLASDGDTADLFGASVAIAGDTVVVGAIWDKVRGDYSGSAYVFTRSEGVWTEQTKLVASDERAGDRFGRDVAIDGDTIVVGAYLNDSRGTDAGSAYVFTRSGTKWTQQARLLASDGEYKDGFGMSAAIEGDTVVIGAYNTKNDSGDSTGSAYIYTRSNGIWTEQTKLLASDGEDGDSFGMSTAIDGDTAVIGSSHSKNDIGDSTGSAYIYTRSGTTWTEEEKLLASDGGSGDNFGTGAAIEGGTVVIGSYSAKNDRGNSTGSAYIYTRSGTTWTEQEKLFVSYGANGDKFGYSVAIEGYSVIIGAYGDDYRGDDSGAAYIFSMPVASQSNIINISTRANIAGGQNDVYAGFVVYGTEPKRVIIRGLSVKNDVNPTIRLLEHFSKDEVGQNDDWQDSENSKDILVLPSHLQLRNKTDAGLLLDLKPGVYDVILSSVGSPGLGVVSVDAVPVTDASQSNLINISTRANISGGQNDVYAGFVIEGAAPKRVILRGLSVSDGVDPTIRLLNHTSKEEVGQNDDWESSENADEILNLPKHLQLRKVTDAALLLDLKPGVYDVVLSSMEAAGLGVVSIDEVPVE